MKKDGKKLHEKKSEGVRGISAFFTMLGAVIGAGFISGRELLQFFGCFRISAVYFAGLLFCFSFLLFVRLGRNHGGFEGAMRGVFGRFARPVKAVIFFGALVSSMGMLSATNSLFPLGKPFVSAAFLVLACFVSEKGVKGIGFVNLLVMPPLLVCVAALVVRKGAFSPSEPSLAGFPTLLAVFLYVSMNSFLSMPVLCELGAKLKNSASFLCFSSSSVIAFAIGFILSAVGADKNSYACDLPLLYILDGAKYFSFLAAGGMLTTLLSSFYPLYSTAGRRAGARGKILLALTVECCSFIGFKSIVAAVYPVLGILGGAAVLFAAARYLSETAFPRRAAETVWVMKPSPRKKT